MNEIYLAKISGVGRGGTLQYVPIPPEVQERLGTMKGQTVRVTIEVDE